MILLFLREVETDTPRHSNHRRSCVVVCLSYGGCRLAPGTSSSVSTTVLSALVAAISSLRYDTIDRWKSAHTVNRATEQKLTDTRKTKVLFYCSYSGIFGCTTKPAQFKTSLFSIDRNVKAAPTLPRI